MKRKREQSELLELLEEEDRQHPDNHQPTTILDVILEVVKDPKLTPAQKLILITMVMLADVSDGITLPDDVTTIGATGIKEFYYKQELDRLPPNWVAFLDDLKGGGE